VGLVKTGQITGVFTTIIPKRILTLRIWNLSLWK